MAETPETIHQAAELTNQHYALIETIGRLYNEIERLERHPDMEPFRDDIIGEVKNAIANANSYLQEIDTALRDWEAVNDYGSTDSRAADKAWHEGRV